MSKEIRRVPRNWGHPTDGDGNFHPLYDEEYDSALLRWVDAVVRWERGDHPDRADAEKEGIRYYWNWESPPPSEQSYRPAYDEPAECFQVYETVSEGTPISPVFETANETLRWLVANGEDEATAKLFLQKGGLAEPIQFTPQGPRLLKVVYDKSNDVPSNPNA